DPVEGPGCHLLAHPEGPETGPQLAGGLPREGQRQHVTGIGGVLLDAPGATARQDARLPRASSGQHAQRSSLRRDRVALRVVEALQERGVTHVSRRYRRGVTRRWMPPDERPGTRSAPSSRGALAPRTPRGRSSGDALTLRPPPGDLGPGSSTCRCTEPGDSPDTTFVRLPDRIGRGPEARPDPGDPASTFSGCAARS